MTVAVCLACDQDTIVSTDNRCSFCQTTIGEKPPAALMPSTTLQTLSDTVNREHALAVTAAHDVVRHAVLAGLALLKAKETVDHGEWEAWLKAHTEVSRALAAIYMRLATYRDIVGDAPTLRTAIDVVKGLPQASPKRPKRTWTPVAQQLRDSGMTYAEIGQLVGRSKKAVQVALNPELAANESERLKARAQQTADERKHQRTLERARRLGAQLVAALDELELVDAATEIERVLVRALDREAVAA